MIGRAERAALEALRFNPAPTPDDIWRPSPFDVPEQHKRAVADILYGINAARSDDDETPYGVALQGQSGSGKTHLLGAVRQRIQDDDNGGYFFVVRLVSGKSFWESTALCLVEGMDRPANGWPTQRKAFLRRLAAHLGISPEVRDAIAGDAQLTRSYLDTFVEALWRFNNAVGLQCQDTVRALVLHGSLQFDAQDIGYAHLIGEPGDPAGRTAWGLTSAIRAAQLIVQDISRLLALTLCPTVIAIDQIDTLFEQTTASLFGPESGLEDAQAKSFGPVADGLLTLRDVTRRTLIVMSCVPDTWELLKKYAPRPVVERFRLAIVPDYILRPEIGLAIVGKRFTAKYARQGFIPRYPTWPIKPAAFVDAIDYTPRSLLRRIERHIRHCLDLDEVIELDHLVDETEQEPRLRQAEEAPIDLRALDVQFDTLVAATDVRSALDPLTEDTAMPALLAAGLAAWVGEQAPDGRVFKLDPPPGKKPALHARLIEVLNEATENEAHWSFRAIASPTALAVNNRIRAACTMAGLEHQVPQRQLVLLRTAHANPWPDTPRAKEIRDAFVAAGGILHDIEEADLRVFSALEKLSVEPHQHFQEWLSKRRPASKTGLFTAVLHSRRLDVEERAATVVPSDVKAPSADTTVLAASDHSSIPLGYTVEARSPFSLDLESLRRHCVIFAGSGSGKTVLIRRLVEECAMQGVSAIVLDPNNDLARLGDPWPTTPGGWEADEVNRAQDYLANTDVVIWTPLVSAGRPLSFQPLPDLGPMRDSPDEFDQVIRATVEALAPRAGVHGATKLAQRGKAVLTEALRAFAATGQIGLGEFTEFLSDLPTGVSRMAKANKLASEAAETLKAAMVTDPLFGGGGTTADPGALLTPPSGKRARISVISFVGLGSDEQRQSFVNQLQMALFGWIKRHPANDRPLGGLLVMDEAQTLAPSIGKTPCTESSIALASQARKYGLGLVFATQAPKGLHNQISGNATTQFFGLLNAPVHIDAARDLAEAKGGKLPDIGMMHSGQFYVAGEGFSFVKVNTPLCLTHHPKSPLSPEEVIQRAR